jgi:hypothetical protein
VTAARRVALIAVALAPLGCTSTTPPSNRPNTGAGAISIGVRLAPQTYHQIIRRFGPPLLSFTKPDHTRCVYYDTVGYQNGWMFCFKGQRIIGAAGNQPAPASSLIRIVCGYLRRARTPRKATIPAANPTKPIRTIIGVVRKLEPPAGCAWTVTGWIRPRSASNAR